MGLSATTLNEILYTPSGEIIATDGSEADFLEKYAEHHCEWVNGTVIKMAPATEQHDELLRYVGRLFEPYFELRPIGILRQMPFLMKLSTGSYREPDLLIVLQSNPNKLTKP